MFVPWPLRHTRKTKASSSPDTARYGKSVRYKAAWPASLTICIIKFSYTYRIITKSPITFRSFYLHGIMLSLYCFFAVSSISFLHKSRLLAQISPLCYIWNDSCPLSLGSFTKTDCWKWLKTFVCGAVFQQKNLLNITTTPSFSVPLTILHKDPDAVPA